MHRAALVLAVSVAFASGPPAQDSKPSQDELLAAKLAAPFLQQAPWLTDWDAALAAARTRQRPIFGYFTTVNH